MSFKTGQMDLAGMIFTPLDFEQARKYLFPVIEKVNRSWIEKPKGPLAKFWDSDSPHATCYLIDTASVLNLFQRRISPRSAPLFYEKVEGILYPKSEKVFIENLNEFQVGYALAHGVSPLDMDPVVPEELLLPLTHHQRPRTPDFAVHLSGERIFFEATVLHIQILDDWDKGVNDITTALQEHLRKKRINLAIQIQFPLPFRGDAVQMAKRLCRRVDASPSEGREVFPDRGEVRWQSIPTFTASDSASALSAFFKTSSSVAAFTASANGEGIGQAFAQLQSFANMSEADIAEANKRLFNSLLNTLRLKKEQVKDAKPVILVLRLGHQRLLREELIVKIQSRIWPKHDYSWITGIAVFTPLQNYNITDAVDHRLELCPNPNAQYKASENLLALFSGNAQFHTRT